MHHVSHSQIYQYVVPWPVLLCSGFQIFLPQFQWRDTHFNLYSGVFKTAFRKKNIYFAIILPLFAFGFVKLLSYEGTTEESLKYIKRRLSYVTLNDGLKTNPADMKHENKYPTVGLSRPNTRAACISS